MNWRDKALCAETGGELFFPEKATPSTIAKALCAECPVAAECLSAALEMDAEFGIWGGLTRSQRLKLTRSLRAPKTK